MGKLKIIATPIGNTRDITLRAFDELKEADVILAEDTRHTGQLLKSLGVTRKPSMRFVSCNAEKEKERIDLVLSLLAKEERVVLVSDAGCPTISDPGSRLIEAVVKSGGSVEVIPGPSALTASLMGAGINTSRFAFLGFLPKQKSAREKLIRSSASAGLALVFYEAPTRVLALLEELHSLFGPRRVIVARELTKMFETFHRGILGSELSPPFRAQGECVVILEAGPENQPTCEEEQRKELLSFIEKAKSQGSSTRDVIQKLVLSYPMKKKAAFMLVHEALKNQEVFDS